MHGLRLQSIRNNMVDTNIITPHIIDLNILILHVVLAMPKILSFYNNVDLSYDVCLMLRETFELEE